MVNIDVDAEQMVGDMLLEIDSPGGPGKQDAARHLVDADEPRAIRSGHPAPRVPQVSDRQPLLGVRWCGRWSRAC